MADEINLPNLVSHLQVNLADTSGIVAEASRQGSSVGAALGDSLQRRVAAAVAAIPEVELDDDSSALDRDLDRVRRELRELAETRIGVDISVDEAIRRMDELEPHLDRLERSHPSVVVQAAVGAARADLTEILDEAHRVDGTDATIDVNANTGRARTELADVDRSTGELTSALRGIGPALSSLGEIGAIAGAGIPALAGIVATLEQIAPAAFIGVSAILAVASAVAAIKVGTSGVGAAIKAAFAPATSGGGAGAAASGTNAVADAQRNLRDVTQQAAQANAQAARQVQSAERDLADAQRASLDAQKALTAAREEATRQLQDENNSLADAKLAERQAVLDVEDAEENLATVRAKGSAASAEDQEKAQLQYDKAVQALQEQQLQVQRLQSDTDAANKAGVNGSQTVQDAQQKVADTARDVADRQQAVSDAQANVARTAQQGAEAIDKAREALQQAGAAGGGAAGGADAFAEAMAKLSPSARAFVQEIVSLKPALDALKLDVQQRLFAGLADELDRTANTLLPVFRTSLDDSADSLNAMGKGTADAARDVSRDGLLGRALAGANAGLRNLIPIPGLVVRAVAQIGVAAAPALDKLTGATTDVVTKVADKLDHAFSSGGLEKAIDTAVDTLGELLHVGGNVVTIVEHILNPAHATGGGFIGILTQITGALAKASGTRGFQDALTALFGVMAEVGKVAGPLVEQALGDLEPVLTHLGPPATKLVDALGTSLRPILSALAPLLVTAADAVGDLVVAVLPLLPVVSQAAAGLGPALQPILTDLVQVFEELEPTVQDTATALSGALQPVLAALPSIVGPFADLVARNLVVALVALSAILQKNAPELAQLGLDLANLLIAAGPLITAFTEMSTAALVKLTPALIVVLDAAARFGTYLSGVLTGLIDGLVIPVIKTLTDLLHGRFGAAWDEASSHAGTAINAILRLLFNLPGGAAAALAPLAGAVSARAVAAANSLTAPVQRGVDEATAYVGSLPAKARRALGDLGGVLEKAGESLIKGFLHGLESQYQDVKNSLQGLTGNLADWKGPPALDAVLLTPAGKSLIQGFMDGIDAQVPALRAQLQGITGQLAGWPSLAGAVPSAGSLAASYAGSAAPMSGPTTINMYGTEATPAGVSSALSWRAKVGRR